MEERREEDRKEISLDARWENGQGRLSDLGLGGCYVDTLGQVSVGEIVMLEIKLPDGSWLPLRGTVAYTHPGLGFSVCFTFLTEDEQEKLSEIINR
ncbi:MAG TPA: PilZ domain-containing protein [Pyrinomonadaceae bacterium]